jgi:tetratricopeptide (TPR) repeat protein
LLELCRQGEFAFILSSRQVGKSSLMVRTAQQLEKENIRSVTIDLSAIGVKVSVDEWYQGILNEIYTTLNLETDIFAWWAQYAQLGPAQRLTNFFRDVLLKEVNEPVVLFFDEIDSTLSIPFSDDFYVALRAVYNARSTTPDFKRLSFVLVGVAAPSDLISDNKRTPFNIGRRVEINDFTLGEALPLANGLGEQAVQVLTWVFQYTAGHPYLTQRLCAYLASFREPLDEQHVSDAVERLFTGEQGKQDNNLQFVRDMLSKRSPDVTRVLLTYKAIRSGKKVVDDERSITKAHLKLSGLVRSEQGSLKVRNEIYNRVFNLHWVQENTPKNWQKVALISVSASLGIIILITFAIVINNFLVDARINRSIADFNFATSSAQRLSDLARIYSQKRILSSMDSSLQAAQLFYGLSANDQISMFKDYAIAQNPELQNDLVVVVSHLYVTVALVNPGEDNTDLLRAMRDSLKIVSNNQAGLDLQNELNAWLDGREQTRSGNYQDALSNYSKAISLNSGNQATLYERAKVNVALEQYDDALQDLDSAVAVAKQSAPDIATPTPTASLLSANAISNTAEAQTRDPSSAPSGTRQPLIMTHTETPTQLPTPTPTPQSLAAPIVARYESNFITFIDVINAVRTLIDSTPGLQVAAQQNGATTYINLQSSGLVRELPSLAASGNITPPTPINTAPPGVQGFYTEEFDGNIDAWNFFIKSGTESEFSRAIDNGKLVVQISPEKGGEPWAYLINNAFKSTDVQVEVVAINKGNNANGISLVCRFSDSGWYEFRISSDGRYSIYAFGPGGTVLQGGYELLTAGSPAIQTGKAENVYTAICKGNELSLAINGSLVNTTAARYDFPEGSIGIGFSSPQNLPVDLEFESVKISEP